MKSQTHEAWCAKGVFLIQLTICIVNFTNMLRSGWTWNNLWNLLTINLKYKCYHNLVQGFIFKGISLHDWKNEKWSLKNVFVKLPCLWYNLIIIPHVEQPPNKLLPICHEKFFEKVPSLLYAGYYAFDPLENHAGVHAPAIFARKCRLRLVNILNLAKRLYRLYDRIGQWVEVLYKTCNVVS